MLILVYFQLVVVGDGVLCVKVTLFSLIFTILICVGISCVGVATADSCKPICDKIGTRSEGWYDSCSGRLIKYDTCSGCEAICNEVGTRNEGWYSSCDNSTIVVVSCHEVDTSTVSENTSESTTHVISERTSESVTCTDTDGKNIFVKGSVTGWDYYKRTVISNSDSCTDYDGGAPKSSGKWVIEEQCDDEGRVSSHYYECPEGYWCEDGRCILRGYDCPEYCEDGWHYYSGKFDVESNKCEYSRRFCKYGCDEEGRTCKIPENVSCSDYCEDGIFWKDGSFNEWTLECEYRYKIECEYGCNEEGTACKSEKKEEPSGEESCEERVRKVIEDTCLNRGEGKEVCEERYKNLVEFECEKKGEVEKPDTEITLCQELRAKLSLLSEELIKSESEEEKEKISEEFANIKREYEKCIKEPEETEYEVEVNICDELEDLEASYNALLDKEERIKAEISAGKTDKTELEKVQREKMFLEKRIEKAKASCKEGSYTETPCLTLSTLMKVEEELNERLTIATGEEAEELKKRLEEVEKEIFQLQKECMERKLTEEEVESLIEAEEVYKSKVQKVLEESSPEEVDEKLQQMENEMKELIVKIMEKLDEVDLRNTEIIREVRVSGSEVYVEDLKLEGKPLRIRIEEKEVYVKPGEEIVIETDGVSAKGKVELLYVNGSLITAKSKKQIRVLPSDLLDEVEAIKEIRLVDEEAPKYKVIAERVGRLLGLIPVSFDVEYEISAEDGELVGESKPWWAFLVMGESNPMPSPLPSESATTPTPQPTPSSGVVNCTIPIENVNFPKYVVSDYSEEGLISALGFVSKDEAVEILKQNGIATAGDLLNNVKGKTELFDLAVKTNLNPESLLKLALRAELRCAFTENELSGTDIEVLGAMGLDSICSLKSINLSSSIMTKALSYEFEKTIKAMGLSKRENYVIPPEKLDVWVTKASEAKPLFCPEKENEDTIIFYDGSSWREEEDKSETKDVTLGGCFVATSPQALSNGYSVSVLKGDFLKITLRLNVKPKTEDTRGLILEVADHENGRNGNIDIKWQEKEHVFYIYNNNFCQSGGVCQVVDHLRIRVLGLEKYEVLETPEICIEEVSSEPVLSGDVVKLDKSNSVKIKTLSVGKDGKFTLKFGHSFGNAVKYIVMKGNQIIDVKTTNSEFTLQKDWPEAYGSWKIVVGVFKSELDVQEYSNYPEKIPLFLATDVEEELKVSLELDTVRKQYDVLFLTGISPSEDSEPSFYWEGEINSFTEVVYYSADGKQLLESGQEYPYFMYREAEDDGGKRIPYEDANLPVAVVPEDLNVEKVSLTLTAYEDDEAFMHLLNPSTWFDIFFDVLAACVKGASCITTLGSDITSCIDSICYVLDLVADTSKAIAEGEDDPFGSAKIEITRFDFNTGFNESYLIEGEEVKEAVNWYDVVGDVGELCHMVTSIVSLTEKGITTAKKGIEKVIEESSEAPLKEFVTFKETFDKGKSKWGKLKKGIKKLGSAKSSGNYLTAIFEGKKISALPLIESIRVDLVSIDIYNDRDGDTDLYLTTIKNAGDIYTYSFVGVIGEGISPTNIGGDVVESNTFSLAEVMRIPDGDSNKDIHSGSTWLIEKTIFEGQKTTSSGVVAGVYVETIVFDEDTFEDDEIGTTSIFLRFSTILEKCSDSGDVCEFEVSYPLQNRCYMDKNSDDEYAVCSEYGSITYRFVVEFV